MCSFSIILNSLYSLNLSFPLLFYVISTTLPRFPPWFPALPSWFPTFFAFPPIFPKFPLWFSAPTFPSHYSHSHPYFPHFSYSVPQFSILAFIDSLPVLWSLRIYFRKIIALVQKHFPLLLLHNSRHQIIVYIIHEVISVITQNYLPYSASSKKSLICEVWANNSEWLKCYLRFMSKGATTCPKLYFFFCNLCQFTKIYATNFVPSQF